MTLINLDRARRLMHRASRARVLADKHSTGVAKILRALARAWENEARRAGTVDRRTAA